MFTEKSHREIWYDFIGYVLTQINALRQDIIFVFFGDIARDWEELIASFSAQVLSDLDPKS